MINLLILLAISVSAYSQCTLVVNPKTRQLTCAGSGTGGGGGTGAAPYSASVTAQTTLTVPAATHGQGTTQALLVSCLDGAGSPWDGAACDYTVSSAGEVVFTWAPAFTGYVVIGGGGTNTPILSGLLSAIPATCTVGAAIYQATDEPPSTQLYACTATDTWTRAAYSQGTAVPGTCVIGEVFFDTDATAGQNLFGCTATNTWTAQAGGGGGGVSSVDATGGVQTASGSAITATGTIRGAHIAKAETGTTYTVLTGDRGKVITFSNAGAIAVTLPQAGAGFEDGWFVIVKNIGAGDVTVTPTTSTISGATAITVSLGEFAIITSNGTNYEAETNRTTVDSALSVTRSRTGTQIGAGATLVTLTGSQALTNKTVTASGYFEIPTSASTTVGLIRQNGSSLLHSFAHGTADGGNFFAGNTSGNFTMSPGGGASSLASYNTGIGWNTLPSMTTGYFNTAAGWGAGLGLTTGHSNTALGVAALTAATTGYQNTGVGLYSLTALTTGYNNAASGVGSLRSNTTGFANAAFGYNALQTATTANGNIAVGPSAGYLTLSGIQNIFIGAYTGYTNSTGQQNVFIGNSAGYYQLGSDKLIIDSRQRVDAATELTDAIIVGTMSDTVASQTLDLNAMVIPNGLRVPNSTSLPGTCTVGDSYMDTDATSGARWYLCESTNTWAVQGGGGGGGTPGGSGTELQYRGGASTFSALPDSSVANTNELRLGATPDTTTATTQAVFTVGTAAIASGSANGNMVGINAPSGFTGQLIQAETNGADKFYVEYDGDVFAANFYTNYSTNTGLTTTTLDFNASGTSQVRNRGSGGSAAMKIYGFEGTGSGNFLAIAGNGAGTNQFRINGDQKAVMIGQTVNTSSLSSMSLYVEDDTATTGATRLSLQEGEGQSTTPGFEYRLNNATANTGTLVWSLAAGGIPTWGSTTEATCNSGTRGQVVMVQGGAGVADTLRVCRKDAADAYAWTALY